MGGCGHTDSNFTGCAFLWAIGRCMHSAGVGNVHENMVLVFICHLICVGTPLAGRVDNLTELHELCQRFNIWLHLEGYAL